MIKESYNKGDDIKSLKKSHKNWNYPKFQIHWNKLEWVFPKSLNVKKNPFCKISHKFYIKYKAMENHWILHLLMKPIDVYELNNIMFITREL